MNERENKCFREINMLVKFYEKGKVDHLKKTRKRIVSKVGFVRVCVYHRTGVYSLKKFKRFCKLF